MLDLRHLFGELFLLRVERGTEVGIVLSQVIDFPVELINRVLDVRNLLGEPLLFWRDFIRLFSCKLPQIDRTSVLFDRLQIRQIEVSGGINADYRQHCTPDRNPCSPPPSPSRL